MKKSTSLSHILQKVIPEEKILLLLNELNYKDVARKFTVYSLFLFLAEASFQQWEGYREAEHHMALCGLRQVDHSTISKKAKDVPYEVFKRLLQLMIELCNRPTRRSLGIPKELLVIDSTQVTVGLGRLPWAPLSGKKAGIKLHLALIADQGHVHDVIETTGKSHDLKIGPDLLDPRFIVVADRAYGKHRLFDDCQDQQNRQYFVIRLKDNTIFHEPAARERKRPFAGTIQEDFTCQLGTKNRRSQHRFRVVTLTDPAGKPVILATNLYWHSAETIADIYKKRWQIEVFFRWIKQHLNIPKLFGTTPNAVYGQLYVALLVYVLLKFLFDQGNAAVHKSAVLTFADFDRFFRLRLLSPEWVIFFANHLSFPECG